MLERWSFVLILLLLSFKFYINSYTTEPAGGKNLFNAKNKVGNLQKKDTPLFDFNNYKLTMQEDFSGNALNTKTWDYLTANTIRGFGKMLRSNIEVSNGTLKIYAKKTITANGNTEFSAGLISTQNSLNQKYGYFEIRAKVNTQTGPHCAFWLIQHSVGVANTPPNPSIYGTEIDIFEYHKAAGNENLYFGLHWNGYNTADNTAKVLYGSSYTPGISNGFHVFGLEWTPKEYIVYVDGKEKIRSSNAVSHTPEFILLSTEITGYGGDRFKMSNTMPDVFEVDYLKVYARKPAVTLYGECDYYGWVSASLLPGHYTKAQLSALNTIDNETSAIEVPPGWIVTGYNNDNFKGDSVIIRTDTKCIANSNNKISSLKIKEK
jgi:beta-glucanase (GH16 family)